MMIRFQLDGKSVEMDTDPMRRLLDVIRDDLENTAVKEGCGEGECGACVVFMDNRIVNSCCVAVGAANGAEITTVDSFRHTDAYCDIEAAFQEAGAVQCGFCTPGMVMAAYALLVEDPHPDEQRIREAIAGNLCRCTGYAMIVDGIRIAAERRTEPW